MINYCVGLSTSAGSAAIVKIANGDAYIGTDFYEGRLLNQPNFSQALFGLGKTKGRDVGRIVINAANEDGGLDFLVTNTGRTPYGYILAIEDDGTPVPLCNFVIDSISGDQRAINIVGREWLTQLDVPFTQSKYAGTNTGSGASMSGIEGTASDIQGQVKPHIWGKVFNLEPFLVNSGKLIYQVQDQASPANGLLSGWSMTVYDRRSALTAGANYTSQSDMETNAPAVGQYRVWPAGGCFRLGSSPVGRVTCDVSNPAQGTTDFTCQAIITRLLTYSNAYGSTAFVELGQSILRQVNASTGVTTTAQNQNGGIYISQPTSLMTVLSQVAGSVGMGMYTVYSDPGHLTNYYSYGLAFRRLYGQTGYPLPLPPPFRSATLNLGTDSVSKETAAPGGSQDGDKGNPASRITVSYQPNYTVMNKTDAPSVSDTVLASISNPFLKVTNLTFAGTGGIFAGTPELVFNTSLYDKAAADDLRVYYGGSGSSSPINNAGYGDNNLRFMTVEVDESILMPYLLSNVLFGSHFQVTLSGVRFYASTMQILSYEATGNRTFRLILRTYYG